MKVFLNLSFINYKLVHSHAYKCIGKTDANKSEISSLRFLTLIRSCHCNKKQHPQISELVKESVLGIEVVY